jgi:hypothetical protein
MTMLGFFCAAAGMLATVMAANDANRPRRMLLTILMVHFLVVDCPRWTGAA